MLNIIITYLVGFFQYANWTQLYVTCGALPCLALGMHFDGLEELHKNVDRILLVPLTRLLTFSYGCDIIGLANSNEPMWRNGIRACLKNRSRKGWGFESLHRHYRSVLISRGQSQSQNSPSHSSFVYQCCLLSIGSPVNFPVRENHRDQASTGL